MILIDGLTLEEAMDIIKENSQKEPKNYWDLPKTPENAEKRLKLAMDAKVQYEHYNIYKRFCPCGTKPLTYKVWLDIVIN